MMVQPFSLSDGQAWWLCEDIIFFHLNTTRYCTADLKGEGCAEGLITFFLLSPNEMMECSCWLHWFPIRRWSSTALMSFLLPEATSRKSLVLYLQYDKKSLVFMTVLLHRDQKLDSFILSPFFKSEFVFAFFSLFPLSLSILSHPISTVI